LRTAFIIASFKELDTLPLLLIDLTKYLDKSDFIVIADDSPDEFRPRIEEFCNSIFQGLETKYLISYGDTKSGRGNAVRRGIREALGTYPEIEFVIEMDADSSHQPKDIIALRNLESEADLIIGSRYLPASQIIGWPLSRRIFSKLLNLIIPKILGIKITDITNGLRRYKAESAKLFLMVEPKNLGFTYLSEQALILHRQGKSIEEIQTTFVNRTVGKSTVTYKEIVSSLRGMFELLKTNRRDH